jgi:hypothetical protein
LLLNSPLRRPPVAAAVCVALALVVGWVAFTFLDFFSHLRPDIAVVFFAALAGSTTMSTVPLLVLWFLDRRERETPWLFAVAFLWGAFIATSLALPFNNAILHAVAAWVARNPLVGEASTVRSSAWGSTGSRRPSTSRRPTPSSARPGGACSSAGATPSSASPGTPCSPASSGRASASRCRRGADG